MLYVLEKLHRIYKNAQYLPLDFLFFGYLHVIVSGLVLFMIAARLLSGIPIDIDNEGLYGSIHVFRDNTMAIREFSEPLARFYFWSTMILVFLWYHLTGLLMLQWKWMSILGVAGELALVGWGVHGQRPENGSTPDVEFFSFIGFCVILFVLFLFYVTRFTYVTLYDEDWKNIRRLRSRLM